MLSKESIKHPFWSLTPEKTLGLLEVGEKGLSEDEIKRRQSVFGKNTIEKKTEIDHLEILWNQIKSPLILILVGSGSIALILRDFKSGLFIFGAVIVNSALGFYQEHKAETALQNIKSYVKERTEVVRENQEIEIDAEKLVPGDIIILRAGKRIAGDARLLVVNELLVNESILTGESIAVEKNPKPVNEKSLIVEQTSMVFAGTYVEEGFGEGVVVSTGFQTELGRIASLISQERKKETPLQKTIRTFALRASLALLAFISILFALGVWKGKNMLEMFIVSIAIGVSAVPEGLPIALTVILAVGVERLAKKKGVVRKLLAAETLGRTTVIITDKTGTLTEANLKLTQIITNEKKEYVLKLALAGMNISVKTERIAKERWLESKSPLEKAIIKAAEEHEILFSETEKEIQVIDHHPFNSREKYSETLIAEKGKKERWIYVGAPEIISERANLGKEEKEKIIKETDTLARIGERVLGVTEYKKFIGLLVCKDSVRKEVRKTIEQTLKNGIRIVIATGDHAGTAIAIAKEVGIEINEESKEVVTGSRLLSMSDKELEESIKNVKIFARITPEDKVRIARMWQKKGEVVAMTGDGVNDAPALQTADVGIALGSGTDVAKGASDLILLDNNFETIQTAIHEGRRMLENIKKTIIYLFSDSLNELFLIGGSLLMGIALPINALQILWVNFFSDSFPAIAFAFEEGDKKTTKPVKDIFDAKTIFLIGVIGTISSALLLVMYLVLLGRGIDENLVRTFIFATFGIYTLLLALSIRKLETSIFTYNPLSNKYLTGGVGTGILLMLSAIYIPALQNTLGTVPLPPAWLGGVLLFGIFNILGVELGKFLFRDKVMKNKPG